ncbi:MAG TPA: hypothetical protein VFH31_08290 [Pyrinomonadaceae bacterium]|nr:hypothetical protein [Pyrinomonadaceae bacterium]
MSANPDLSILPGSVVRTQQQAEPNFDARVARARQTGGGKIFLLPLEVEAELTAESSQALPKV